MEHNDAESILQGTEELVREVMERNRLAPEDMVSCIFTSTPDMIMSDAIAGEKFSRSRRQAFG